jgi:hypothetical protein
MPLRSNLSGDGKLVLIELQNRLEKDCYRYENTNYKINMIVLTLKTY